MHKTRQCSFTQLLPELHEQVTAQLLRDETALVCFESILDSPITVIYAYVITQRRLIKVELQPYGLIDRLRTNEKYLIREVSSIFLSDIVATHITNSKEYGGGVSIQGNGDTSMGCWIIPSLQQQFAGILQCHVNNAKGRARVPISQSQRSLADRLRELTQLHQSGFISDAEFEQKRKEILGKL